MTKIIAHRGASGYAPENTMEAFELAVKQKADGIEIDVHLSKDNQVIIMHDETINRTTNGHGYIKDYTFEELQSFNANNDMADFTFCHIPRLEELLELIKESNTLLNIELKTDQIHYKNIEEIVLELVKQYKVEHLVFYSSFNHYSMTKIKELDSNAKIGLLYFEGLYQPWNYALLAKADALHPFHQNLKIPNYIAECHRNNIKVNVWTVNDVLDMQKYIAMDVDGIITNFPDIALNLLEK